MHDYSLHACLLACIRSDTTSLESIKYRIHECSSERQLEFPTISVLSKYQTTHGFDLCSSCSSASSNSALPLIF